MSERYPSDEVCDGIISHLDDIAREDNNYDYGLPIYDADLLQRMRDAIRTALEAEVGTSQQRIEWVAAALHGDPFFGPGAEEPLVKQVDALRAEVGTLREDRQTLALHACMEAIEQTIKVCDAQEREGMPFEIRAVDYAGIARAAIAKYDAARTPNDGAHEAL